MTWKVLLYGILWRMVFKYFNYLNRIDSQNSILISMNAIFTGKIAAIPLVPKLLLLIDLIDQSLSSSVSAGNHSLGHCGSLLHQRCRSRGRAASESTSGWWGRAEPCPCDCAGSWPRPPTLAPIPGTHHSRCHCRADQRLPPLERTVTLCLNSVHTTVIYDQMINKRTSWVQCVHQQGIIKCNKVYTSNIIKEG